jgi:parallel beta-helix repeat protein
VVLRSYNGGILIRDTKVTSWDEAKGTYDMRYDDGRAYIVAQASGRMDVLNSEIAYLGYPRDVEIKRGTMNGGIYGLSWKIPNGTFGRHLLTGVVRGSKIHDNSFGMYMYGATGMAVENNEVYRNVQYGIDPHDDSNNLLIAGNNVHNNGNHGIIGSKRVVYSTIRDNRSVDNRLHGIMLDRQSNFNIVEDNEVSGNVNGLALYDSHDNLLRGNTVVGNRFGIRANMNSSENRFAMNTLRGNDRAIFIYGGAKDNVAIDNTIVGNVQALALKETEGNIFVSAIPLTNNLENVYFDPASRTTNYVQRMP